MNSTLLSFGRKVVNHKVFEDFVYYLPMGFVWAVACGLYFGLDTFLTTFFIFVTSVVGVRALFSFMSYWITITQNIQTELTSGIDEMLEENKKKELLAAELSEQEVKIKKPKSIPPKAKETVVIQTKRMTLKSASPGRPGRKPRVVPADTKKET